MNDIYDWVLYLDTHNAPYAGFWKWEEALRPSPVRDVTEEYRQQASSSSENDDKC